MCGLTSCVYNYCLFRMVETGLALKMLFLLFLRNHLSLRFRFWWSLVSEVDWWDVVATTQAAAEDGNGLLLHALFDWHFVSLYIGFFIPHSSNLPQLDH